MSRQISPDVAHQRALIANAVRHGDPTAELEARRELKTAMLADAIRKTVDSAPPLTNEQRTRLARLLRPGAKASA